MGGGGRRRCALRPARRRGGLASALVLAVTMLTISPAHARAGPTTIDAPQPANAPAADPVTFSAGGMQPLVPARLLDTRLGIGAPVGAVGAGSVTVLHVAGRGGVPSTGVGAVVLNVTVTEPTASSYITVFPTGAVRPTAANLNMVAGQTVPNLVIAKVGDGGAVSLFNYAGSTHLVADVAGWFPEGSGFEPLVPARVLDTREGIGAPVGAVGAGSVTSLSVLGVGGVPSSGVGAVVLNVTVTEPTASSYITVFPHGAERPTAANLNMVVGQTVPNLVIAKVGDDGIVDLYNYAGSTHLVADVAGWFPDGGAGATTIQPKAGTVLAGGGDVVSAVPSELGGGTVVLSASADVPAVDGFLAIAPNAAVPAGLSGRVTGVSLNADGTTTVQLTAALIDEMFDRLDTAYSGPIDIADDRDVAPSLAQLLPSYSCSSPGLSVNFGLDLAGSTVDVDVGLGHALFSLSTTIVVSAGVTASSPGSCTVSFPLGWLPVGGPLAIQPTVGITVKVTGSLSASASISIPAEAGFEYIDGTFHNLSHVSADATGDLKAAATATVSVGPFLGASLTLFGIEGSSLTVGPIAEGAVTVTSAGVCIVFDAYVRAQLAVSIDKWFINVNVTLLKIDSPKIKLVESGDGCNDDPPPVWAGTITMHNVHSSPSSPGTHGLITSDATITLQPSFWTEAQVEDPANGVVWSEFVGAQHAAVTGTYGYDTYLDGCDHIDGSASFSYGGQHYTVVSATGQSLPAFGGWFVLTTDWPSVTVAGLEDVANWVLVTESGAYQCQPASSVENAHPLYPPSSGVCNDVVRDGIVAAFEAAIAGGNPPPTTLASSGTGTVELDTCSVTWNLHVVT